MGDLRYLLMRKFQYRSGTCKYSNLYMLSTLVQCITLFIACVLGIIGFPVSNYNIMILAAMFLWISGFFFCIKNIANRVLLLLFDIVIFVFLMCRPIIDVLKGATRWHYYADDSIYFAITSVAVSLIFLHLGCYFCERCFRDSADKSIMTLAPQSQSVVDFRMIAFLLYLICMVFFMASEMDKVIFMQGRSYTEFYTGYTSSLPGSFYTISQMMPYALCVYLATLPPKKPAFFAQLLYVLSAIPQLIIGIRNPIVLNVIFVLIYYLMRDCIGDKEKWLGKVEKLIIIIGAPIAAFGLSVMNYLRAGNSNPNGGFFASIIDLFYKQGVSFDVLCMAHNAIPNLPGGTKCYTFGPFIDGISQSRIGQVLFDVAIFPSGNNEIRAVEGNIFAHSMSYVAHPDYLTGSGWGSSYILETFADFGWFGIIIYSFIFGCLFVFGVRAMKRGWFMRIVLLAAFMQLMFIPRAEALGFLSFLISIHFWLVVIFCMVMGEIFMKMDLRKRNY